MKFKERHFVKECIGATLTNAIMTGTSTNGPITAANTAPESSPNTATATAMASSKLFRDEGSWVKSL